MVVGRLRTWREWFYQTFVSMGTLRSARYGTEAERQEAAQRAVPPQDITKLNLDSTSPPNG